ncbi:MAG TPA: exodeoxyribonuclease VII small subunit [Oculatellaceae cyanobacterium]|jgi:exodeoxyribonuclease VII small subunit
MNKPNTSKNTQANNITIQTNWNYETTVAKVEEIINKIESGKMELADVFDEFAAATEYLRDCEKFLSERQQQMDVFIETLEKNAETLSF